MLRSFSRSIRTRSSRLSRNGVAPPPPSLDQDPISRPPPSGPFHDIKPLATSTTTTSPPLPSHWEHKEEEEEEEGGDMEEEGSDQGGLFALSDDEEDPTYARVLARRRSVALGVREEGMDTALFQALRSGVLSEGLELKIAELADGDMRQEHAMLVATSRRKTREKRDYELAGEARMKALDRVLGMELERLAASATPATAPLHIKGGGVKVAAAAAAAGGGALSHYPPPPSSPTPLTLTPALQAMSLIYRAAHAVATSVEGGVGAGREEQLLGTCRELGVDVSALQRLAYAFSEEAAKKRLAMSARKGGAFNGGSNSGEEEEEEEEGGRGGGGDDDEEDEDGVVYSSSDSDLDWGGGEGLGGGRRRKPSSKSSLPNRYLPREDRELRGIALPPFPPSAGGKFKLGGVSITEVPEDAPGDLNPAATGEVLHPSVAGGRESLAELRARSELFIATKLLLQALAATAMEEGGQQQRLQHQHQQQQQQRKTLHHQSRVGVKGEKEEDEEGDAFIDVLADPSSAASLPQQRRGSAKGKDLLQAARLLLDSPLGGSGSNGGSGGGGGGGLGVNGSMPAILKDVRISLRGWGGKGSDSREVGAVKREDGEDEEEEEDKYKVLPPIVFTAREKRGSPMNGLPIGGPGGIQALAGLSRGSPLAGVGSSTTASPPPPIPITAEEATELAMELGYPPRDPSNPGLALVVDREAAQRIAAFKKEQRGGGGALAFNRAAKKSALEALEASLAPNEAAMSTALLDAVDAEDRARGGTLDGTPRKTSLLPPGFRDWNEVVSTASASPRGKYQSNALAGMRQTTLDARIKPVKDGRVDATTPRAHRMGVNMMSTLCTLLAEGSVGALAVREPHLFPAGLPLEVVEVSVTPDFRGATVRWTLPGLARLREKERGGGGSATAAFPPPPLPPSTPISTFTQALEAGEHLTSPHARALFARAAVARGERGAQVAKAHRKPKAKDAYSPGAVVGGGITPYLFPGGKGNSTAGASGGGGGGGGGREGYLASQVTLAEAALERVAWGLRRTLAERLQLRFVPRLKFFLYEGPRNHLPPGRGGGDGGGGGESATMSKSVKGRKAAQQGATI